VANIEIGLGVVIPLAYRVQNKRAAECAAGLQTRSIIHGLGESVIEVHCQACSKALTDAQGTGMVIRVGNAAESRQGAVLRVEEEVPAKTVLDHVLGIGPVVTVEVQRYRIYGLCLVKSVTGKDSTTE